MPLQQKYRVVYKIMILMINLSPDERMICVYVVYDNKKMIG